MAKQNCSREINIPTLRPNFDQLLLEGCFLNAAIGTIAANSPFVRIADIYVFSREGPLCSLSFECERYSPQAHYVDGKAF